MTSAATIDLSAVDALSADELTAQIALADVVFARVRINDPRRSSLAYSDAKLVVQVLTAERRRREEKAAVEAAELILIEALTATRTDRRPDGFTNAMLAQLDDEAFE